MAEIKSLNGYAFADEKARADIAALAEGKLDKQHGAENANRLLYVGEDGSTEMLQVGGGLKIADGKIRIADEELEVATTTYTQDEVCDYEIHALLDKNGVAKATSAWRVSPWIRMSAGDTVEFHLACYSNNTSIAFCNAAYGLISGYYSAADPQYPNLYTDDMITAPEGTVYMRFCMYTENEYFTNQYVTTRVTTGTSASKKIYVPDELYGKILSATGDSITAATYSVPGNSYVEQIANKHAMEVENKAIWGAVFATGITNTDGSTVPSILDTIATMRSDADYIIISGGINDTFKINDGSMQLGEIMLYYANSHDTSTFCGAFEETLKQALLKWPGKKILFVIEHRMNVGYAADTDKLFHETVYPKMLQMLHHWGVPYVDLYHDMPSLAFITEYRDLYTYDADGDGVGDGWHPNAEGYKLFYVPRVEAGLRRI